MKKLFSLLIILSIILLFMYCNPEINPEEEYYLPGEWEITIQFENSSEIINETYYFEGGQNKGTFRTESNNTGSFTANNQLVFFMFDDSDWKFNGEFTDFENIRGIFQINEENNIIKGTFTAHRIQFYL